MDQVHLLVLEIGQQGKTRRKPFAGLCLDPGKARGARFHRSNPGPGANKIDQRQIYLVEPENDVGPVRVAIALIDFAGEHGARVQGRDHAGCSQNENERDQKYLETMLPKIGRDLAPLRVHHRAAPFASSAAISPSFNRMTRSARLARFSSCVTINSVLR